MPFARVLRLIAHQQAEQDRDPDSAERQDSGQPNAPARDRADTDQAIGGGKCDSVEQEVNAIDPAQCRRHHTDEQQNQAIEPNTNAAQILVRLDRRDRD